MGNQKDLLNLREFESSWRSQHGEDGVITKIFEVIPPKNGRFVEIGAAFHEANCLKVRWQWGWLGVFIDAYHHFPDQLFHGMTVSRENINGIFERMIGIPDDFDLFSLDIDGVDFYIWNALSDRWKPRVVIVEMNYEWGLDDKVVVYDPDFKWDDTNYQGASATAWMRLADKKGYSLVYIESTGTNMFFVRNDLIPPDTFSHVNDVEYFVSQAKPNFHAKQDSKNRRCLTSSYILGV